MLDNKKLAYSRKEVAELLGLHVNTIDKYVRLGVLPARKLGSRWLIPASALREWLEGHENYPAGQGGGE
ncbi:DNA binding domain protein, excisionase family [Allomeiothermus silvanus DSM 9946]|uniref:DNA binding domain protein, excisionase family n=1 Tax=Allomeiothermus silvanus (strain ATCC 700542 / DSM 9946 / NBRC 106475 / NCIMB 13440 / VI-R2) TaxID=526227 RepID=D7BFB6_ALLS1|nr:helix-turn-helix domain-containing protein [Allomeiothermus silvanus]ADH63469.1 DNA binding domain protein, excisionase family [Allomeiothermus silvanus DSM 9946]